MKTLFAIMTVAVILTALACNNNIDSAAAIADSTRVADSAAKAMAKDDSVKAVMVVTIDSLKAIAAASNSAKTMSVK